ALPPIPGHTETSPDRVHRGYTTFRSRSETLARASGQVVRTRPRMSTSRSAGWGDRGGDDEAHLGRPRPRWHVPAFLDVDAHRRCGPPPRVAQLRCGRGSDRPVHPPEGPYRH